MAGPKNFVPVTAAPTLPPGLAPGLQYFGGPVLGSVEVLPIFWGSLWAGDPTDPNAAVASGS